MFKYKSTFFISLQAEGVKYNTIYSPDWMKPPSPPGSPQTKLKMRRERKSLDQDNITVIHLNHDLSEDYKLAKCQADLTAILKDTQLPAKIYVVGHCLPGESVISQAYVTKEGEKKYNHVKASKLAKLFKMAIPVEKHKMITFQIIACYGSFFAKNLAAELYDRGFREYFVIGYIHESSIGTLKYKGSGPYKISDFSTSERKLRVGYSHHDDEALKLADNKLIFYVHGGRVVTCPYRKWVQVNSSTLPPEERKNFFIYPKITVTSKFPELKDYQGDRYFDPDPEAPRMLCLMTINFIREEVARIKSSKNTPSVAVVEQYQRLYEIGHEGYCRWLHSDDEFLHLCDFSRGLLRLLEQLAHKKYGFIKREEADVAAYFTEFKDEILVLINECLYSSNSMNSLTQVKMLQLPNGEIIERLGNGYDPIL